MLVDPPPRADPTEVAGELWWLERAVAVAEGGPHTVVAEADDVGAAVPGEIGEVPGVLVDPPPRADPTEVAGELWWLERAVAVAEGGPHTVVAEADDVGTAVTGEIGEEPGMLVDPPRGVDPEVGNHELWWLERAVAVAEGGPHTVVAEADDVNAVVTGEIGEEPGMLVDPPPGTDPTEVAAELWWLERAVAVTEGGPHTVVAEADDVNAAVPGEELRLLVDPPIGQPGGHDLRWLECAAAAADRGPHTAGVDDFGAAGSGEIGDEPRMLIGPVQSCPAHRSCLLL